MVNFTNTKIDRTSNYQVTIDFCFTDETFTCAKTITYTVENDVFCPDIVISDITGTSFKYRMNGLNPALGYQVSVICETKNGSEIGRVNYSNPDSTILGDFGGLVGGQSYQVYTEITSNGGNTTSCEKTLVTTLVPSCTTVELLSSAFGDVADDLKGAKITLGCYNDGANKWKTVAGFDSDHNFKVVKYDDPAADCSTGDIVTYGTFTSDDPSLSIVCGGKTYVSGFPQSSLGSGWQYVNTINGPDNNPYYIYALVNKITNSIDHVIACCDCKAVYIKTHNTMSYCVTGKQTDIKIDIAGFVNGLEKPRWSLSSPPFYGSAYLNNTKSTATEVVYTYSNGSTTPWTSDSFKIKVENNCGTSNELIIPVSRAKEIPKRDGDITVFVDTCTITKSQADSIKLSFESLKGAIQVLCSNWNGTINYVPVDSTGDSGDYVNHAKAMVDMRAGATGSVTVAGGAWTDWKSLPAHWNGAHKGSIPTSAYIFSFVNNVSVSCGSYGESTLSAGFGAQPTASYQQNYDELLDIVNGTTTTAWGASMNSTQPGWGYPIFGTATDKTKYFSHVVMPIITGTNDSSAGAALQMAGAILGKFANTAEFNGLKMGDVQYPINAAGYILDGTASYPVPYNVTTPRGNAMTGLQDYGYLNSAWLENGVDFGALNLDLKAILLSIVGLTEGSSGFNCVAASSGGVKMADSAARNLFSFGASCANASNAARSSTNPLCIYNNTGVIFDGSVGNELAYKTQQGCSEAIADDQIDDGWYAVIDGANNYGVAQYTEDSGWSNVKCTDGVGGCKSC